MKPSACMRVSVCPSVRRLPGNKAVCSPLPYFSGVACRRAHHGNATTDLREQLHMERTLAEVQLVRSCQPVSLADQRVRLARVVQHLMKEQQHVQRFGASAHGMTISAHRITRTPTPLLILVPPTLLLSPTHTRAPTQGHNHIDSLPDNNCRQGMRAVPPTGSARIPSGCALTSGSASAADRSQWTSRSTR